MELDKVILAIQSGLSFWGPLVFAGLVATSVGCMWMAFAPRKDGRTVEERLSVYGKRDDVFEDDMDRSFLSRAVVPFLRGIIRSLGRLMPRRSLHVTEEMLMHAGQPGNLSAIDFFGIQILVPLLFAALYIILFGRNQPLFLMARNALMVLLLGFLVPRFWLRMRVRRRKHAIARALPDALDMMTIGVEAGLAFETAMLRVGDQWDNPLTREFRRAVAEMRVGTARDEALRRMAERAGVDELRTFVAVLIQSTQLGVTIAQVLHTQAAEMRVRRRQRAEELARQASVKMVFPLIFFIFPALMGVMLGPSIPIFREFFANLRESVSTFPMQ